MPEMYMGRTFVVKRICASGVLYSQNGTVHHMYMARKKQGPPRQKQKRLYGPHFLRAWRLKRGMTLEQAAGLVGKSHAQLQRIETHQQKYNQELLEKLSALYGVSVTALIERNPLEMELWQEIDRYAEFLRNGRPQPPADGMPDH